MWLLYFNSMLKIETFSPIFPLKGSIIGGILFGYSFEISRRLCHSMQLFHLHSMVKIQPFSPVFPLAESTAKVFCRLFLWNFKEKSINHFL